MIVLYRYNLLDALSRRAAKVYTVSARSPYRTATSGGNPIVPNHGFRRWQYADANIASLIGGELRTHSPLIIGQLAMTPR